MTEHPNELEFVVEEGYQPRYPPEYGLYRTHCPTILAESPNWNFSKQTRVNYREERKPWSTSFHPKIIKQVMVDGIEEISIDDVINHWQQDSLLLHSPPGKLERIKSGKVSWYYCPDDEKAILRVLWKIDRLMAEKLFPAPRSFSEILQTWLMNHQARERALAPRDWMVWSDKRYPSFSGLPRTACPEACPQMKGLMAENRWCYEEKQILETLGQAIEEIVKMEYDAKMVRENNEFRLQMEAEEAQREHIEREAEIRRVAEENAAKEAERFEKEKRNIEMHNRRLKQEEKEAKMKEKIANAKIKANHDIANAHKQAAAMQAKTAQYQSQMTLLSAQLMARQIDPAAYAAKCEELAKLLK